MPVWNMFWYGCDGFPEKYSGAYGSFSGNLLTGRVGSLSEYDRLFKSYELKIFTTDNEKITQGCTYMESEKNRITVEKMRIAYCRLEEPFELQEEHRLEYEAYLKDKSPLIIPLLDQTNEQELIHWYMDKKYINYDKIHEVIEWANREHKTELLAALLGYQHRNWPDEVYNPPELTEPEADESSQDDANTYNLDNDIDEIPY